MKNKHKYHELWFRVALGVASVIMVIVLLLASELPKQNDSEPIKFNLNDGGSSLSPTGAMSGTIG